VTEDVLEQLVEDYYSSKAGFFTKHNVKFRPSKDHISYESQMDSVHSDIDVIAISSSSPNTVHAISCKSWQGGLNVARFMKSIEQAITSQPQKTKGRRDDWCTFRELCISKWTKAFTNKLREEIAAPSEEKIKLHYFIACTLMTPGSISSRQKFEESELIKKHFLSISNVDIKLKVITVRQLVEDLISTTRFKSFAFRRTALACKDIGNGISARSSFGLRYQVSHHMGDEIPLPGTAGRDSATGAGANTANMHESRRRHNTRKHRKGSCAYTGIGTADTSASEAGPVYQGTLIKIDPRGVSAFAQEVLGPAYVGERIFLLHGRSCHRGNNT
jgi:hypothetical protein